MKILTMKSLIIAVFVLLAFACNKPAFIEMPQVFTDNMVLQQNANVKIWGKASIGAKLTIEGSWGSTVTCQASSAGSWMAELPTIEAGGPYELKIISGEVNKEFKNVMLGEVWICSGQSNMEMPLISNWAKLNNAEQEVANASYQNIRLFTVQKNLAFNEIDSITTDGWQICDSSTIRNFSATAYFFGRKLFKELNVPIGLIHTSWGGTVAEAWTSKNSLLDYDDFAETTKKIISLKASKDSLKRKYTADSTQMFNEIALADIGLEGDIALYADPAFDDSDWFPIDLPKMWEETELGVYDGSTWFRKEVNLTKGMVNSGLTLCYGAPDDWDEAWVNGIKVGENRAWDVLREYEIPKGAAKVGKNIITLRVYDYTGGGGFMGEAKNYKIVSGNGKSLSIAKGWVAKKGFDFRDIETIPVSLTNPNQPTVLFNAMINPLLPYTIQGAIWYQGESNAGRAHQYRKLFKTMITDWRTHWNQGDFSFYFVQLANYLARNTKPVEDSWAELREAQTMALELPNTGMAVAIDIGDALDIHPGNKQDVGKRLALNALAKTYGKNIAYSGPMYKNMEVKGNSIELTFDEVYEGLEISEGKTLKGFTIAGADKKFVWANAKIVDNKVVVSSAKVSNPVSVRYGWASNPEVNLVNSVGLPASPFRTDDWQGITD